MHFGWKVLVPVATVWILLTAGAVAYKEARNLSTPTPVSLPAAES
jgi:hypothetical protein